MLAIFEPLPPRLRQCSMVEGTVANDRGAFDNQSWVVYQIFRLEWTFSKLMFHRRGGDAQVPTTVLAAVPQGQLCDFVDRYPQSPASINHIGVQHQGNGSQ